MRKERAFLFCFTGIDGSGKTTQAQMLIDWLESRGVKSTYVWSRGEVLTIRSIFLSLGRRALGTSSRQIASDKNSFQAYQTRKMRFKSNPLVRTLWSVMTRIEHLVQINRDIRSRLREGWIVVCDRYLWDSIADLAVLHNKNPGWLLNRLNTFMWRFVPRPALTFYIDIPAEEALRRKDDIPSYEYVKRRVDLYRFLAQSRGMEVIDGCASPQAIHNQIIGIIHNRIEIG